ncbi:peptidylprolyl isomerase [Blastopirellula retiformator]|uniref:peptidylprolyl isomerase n=1 Tax=Blastopirellula retiformator TaxID=2527970 RepID=A0A5C5VM51_9BACT|nr:peptidylprolyl isomerase [Blastopirellula retiformator]TWT39060.1 putative peptidyl-prolyl cis-trans isomerase [Blastopirellula retiformator]
MLRKLKRSLSLWSVATMLTAISWPLSVSADDAPAPVAPPTAEEKAEAAPAETPAKPEMKQPAAEKPADEKPSAEEKPKAEPGEKAAIFNKKFAEWKTLLAKLRGLQEDYRLADEDKLVAIHKEYDQALDQGEVLMEEIKQAAIDAFEEAPGSNADAINFMILSGNDAQKKDKNEEAYKIGRSLIEHGIENGPIYSMTIRAAFGADRFDDAVEVTEMAVKYKKSSGDEDFAPSEEALGEANASAVYREFWKKEQEIRAKEAEADDLPRVKLTTDHGDIIIELFENEAPQTVANFISLVNKGFYDGLSFHRVLENFMAQGGDPKGDGTGGPGYHIYCECYKPNFRRHFSGTLSMAHAGRDTGGSQFFITFRPTPGLDGKHTAFGRVIEGMDVVTDIQRRDPEALDAATPEKIIKAEVIRDRGHEYKPAKVH